LYGIDISTFIIVNVSIDNTAKMLMKIV